MKTHRKDCKFESSASNRDSLRKEIAGTKVNCEIGEEQSKEDVHNQNQTRLEFNLKKPRTDSPSSSVQHVIPPGVAGPCSGPQVLQPVFLAPNFPAIWSPQTGFHPFPPVASMDNNSQTPGADATQVAAGPVSGNGGQIPGACYPFGIPYPAYSVPQSPAISSETSLNSSQKGRKKRSSVETPQKHHVIPESQQSAENAKLWSVIGNLNSELTHLRRRLVKLETNAKRRKPSQQEQPQTHDKSRESAYNSGRPPVSVLSSDGFPVSDVLPPRPGGTKPLQEQSQTHDKSGESDSKKGRPTTSVISSKAFPASDVLPPRPVGTKPLQEQSQTHDKSGESDSKKGRSTMSVFSSEALSASDVLPPRPVGTKPLQEQPHTHDKSLESDSKTETPTPTVSVLSCDALAPSYDLLPLAAGGTLIHNNQGPLFVKEIILEEFSPLAIRQHRHEERITTPNSIGSLEMSLQKRNVGVLGPDQH